MWWERGGIDRHGSALPTSDVNIVAQLPEKTSATQFLKEMLGKIKSDKRCAEIKDVIDETRNVEFDMAGIHCDFTAWCGNIIHTRTGHPHTLRTLALKVLHGGRK